MRIFSYRNKRILKRALVVLCVLAALALMFCLCRFIYLQRYLVYSEDGVRFDYDQQIDREPQISKPQWDPSDVEIITQEPAEQVSTNTDVPMTRLSGYYLSTEMLLDMERVKEAMAETEEMDAVMLDLKSIYGNFYYSSGLPGAVKSSADIAAVDNLIEQLANDPNVYLIARIAALSDNNFALDHQNCGLPLRSGALWMDSNGCYWLDPMKEEVQSYLVAIAEELAFMGFDEVVFDGFVVPDSTSIVYSGELTREQAAADAAESISAALENAPIRVSFNSENQAVAEVSDRIYLVTDNGSAVAGLVEGIQASMEDPAAQIVFLTASRDTRFEGYGLLRPLIEKKAES